jgi:catechol 2,3-dioxygenase-like lactoylglutathione lyase family enzyme
MLRSMFSSCGWLLAVVLISQQVSAATSVVRRTTLLVRDIERSIQFYRASGGLPLNGKPAYSRIVVMSGKDDAIGMVGLLQYDHPPLAATREDTGTIGVTDAVLVVQTDDIKQVHENLKRLGAPILQPPQDYDVRSVDTHKYGAIMFFVDPDGHVIEMSQVYRVEPL